jgi:hypothetical protein
VRAAVLLVLVCVVAPAGAQTGWLHRLDRALAVDSPGGLLRAELSGLLDVEGYYIDQRAPGLIFGGGSGLVNPRLSLFLDARLGRHLYGFVQARFDRGFDPRARPEGSARPDEYLLRWTPFDDARLNVQFGKFATVVGNWVARHDSWNNPLINAPLPYENVTIITDAKTPGTLGEFLARRNLPDRKRDWVPVVWGPSYAAGGAVFGRVEQLDYAAEVKNAALSSRPHVWDPRIRGWDDPTASGRLGWRPGAAWALGVSLGSGAYLQGKAERTLAPGRDVGDFRQSVLGTDASYAWRRLQLWGEFFAARFAVPIARPPTTVDADTTAYYVEARYKLTPEVFAGLRWNQQFFGEVPDGRGGERTWDRDVWRVDAALAYRFDRHLQAKLQYAFTRQTGGLQQGEQLVAAQVTLKF